MSNGVEVACHAMAVVEPSPNMKLSRRKRTTIAHNLNEREHSE